MTDYANEYPQAQPGARKTFGRLRFHDERSDSYKIRKSRLTLWRSLTARLRTSVRHRAWWQGDQGSSSRCTEFMIHHMFEAGKAHARGRGKPLYGVPRPALPLGRIYTRAQELDPWPGSELQVPYYEGSSCTAAAKAAQEFGLIEGYDWEFDDIEVCERAIFTAPLGFGVDWRSGMMLEGQKRTRWEDAVIRPIGSLVGGHAIAAVGFDKRRKGAEWELLNSWSEAWGFHGRCYIGRDDLAQLLAADGECVMLRDAPDDAVLAALKKVA